MKLTLKWSLQAGAYRGELIRVAFSEYSKGFSLVLIKPDGCERTLWSSIDLLISRSCLRRLRSSSVSSSLMFPEALISARFRLPIVSSARRACRSAGVSVQRELSAFREGWAVRANCRGRVSLVGSIAKVERVN